MKKISKDFIELCILVILICIILGGALVVAGKHNQKNSELSSNLVESTVKVMTIFGSGSGIVIKSTPKYSLALSNKHVCMSSPIAKIKVVTNLGKEEVVEAYISKIGVYSDLCLIKIDKGGLPPVKLAKGYKLHEKVFVIGNPLGIRGVKTVGYIGRPKQVFMEQMVQISVPIYPGNSGSGVLNTGGELVGIATAAWAGAEHLAFMIRLEDIEVFLGGVL